MAGVGTTAKEGQPTFATEQLAQLKTTWARLLANTRRMISAFRRAGAGFPQTF
jgi:hypothetical protein